LLRVRAAIVLALRRHRMLASARGDGARSRAHHRKCRDRDLVRNIGLNIAENVVSARVWRKHHLNKINGWRARRVIGARKQSHRSVNKQQR